MQIRTLISSVLTMFYLFSANCGLAAGGPHPSSKILLAQNSSTEEELLMYYDEKELVTANKRPTSLRRAPAIATIITADEIMNMGALNIVDILKMVPGFGVSVNEFGTLMIEVRGIRTSQNEKILFMIDGHSMNKNTNGNSFIWNVVTMLPIENIKQIEIVRGPGSALYGNSAFVATINIITRNAEEINGLEVKSGGGTSDTFKGSMVGGKALGDKLTLMASMDHYQTQGDKLNVNADFLTPIGSSKAPGYTDLRTKQTDFFVKIGYGDLSFRGHYLTKRHNTYIGLGYALVDNSHNDLDNYWGELAYDKQISDGLTSNTKIRYDAYIQDGYAEIFPNGANIGTGPFPDGMIGKPYVKNRNIGVEEQVSWTVYENHHLIAGASFDVLRQYATHQQANFDPNTFAPIGAVQEVANWNKDVTRKTWALYWQYEWQAFDDLNLTAGVRHDNYSDFGSTTNPRAAIVWNFRENADLKLLYGKAFRAPNFVELYQINNPSQQGNPNLKPERIETYEAALVYRFNRLLATDLNYFYSSINDMIFLNNGVPGVYGNRRQAITQGVEFGVNGSFESDIYWKLSYAWQEPRDAETNKPLPYVPAQRAKASVNYTLNKYVNIHTDLLWTGVRPREQGDTRPQMPSYFTADMAVTFRNFLKTFEIQAAVKNLFDQKYSDPDTSGALKSVPGDFPRPGISALLTASYKF